VRPCVPRRAQGLHAEGLDPAREMRVTLKTFLLALTAAAAIFGAAIVGVPSTSEKAPFLIVRSN
jgi:hypothetical protein